MKKINLELNLFCEEDIQLLYEKYVNKPDEYYQKAHDEYQKLSDEEKERWFPADFPRLASLFDYKEWVEKYNLKHVNKLLATCEHDCELELISYDTITVCDYLQDKRYDLHTMDLEDKDYAEISETLGISEVNARVKMNRIKGKLKKILNP